MRLKTVKIVSAALSVLLLCAACSSSSAVTEGPDAGAEQASAAPAEHRDAAQPEDAEPAAQEKPPRNAVPEENGTVESAEADAPSEEPDAEPKEAQVLERFEPWLERNPYVAAWLNVGDGALDAPVLYTPRDQNFFLQRDIDGNKSSRGSLFIAIPWREGNNHTLVYGHNAPDGSMFAKLLQYKKESYALAHPSIRFDTLHGEGEYRLLGVFFSRIFETNEIETKEDRRSADAQKGEWKSVQELDLSAAYPSYDIYRDKKDIQDGNFRYYYYTDLSDPEDFAYYVDQVKQASLYDTGVTAEWGDQLLTLSTCSGGSSDGRFVVVACRKAAQQSGEALNG